jgi:DNA-binding NarL/FixJ family response regulator
VKPIRVLLADDHETVRQGLRLLIDAQSDMTVVGEAGDGLDATAKAQSLDPDVVVLDISMPEMNGLVATHRLREVAPSCAIVALTRYRDETYVTELLREGASGYVLKQSRSGELLGAIRVAASGGRYLDSALSKNLVDSRPKRGEAPPRLTDREAEVLRLVALGHSNKEIAGTLDLSVRTVEVHKANSMRKLGLAGRIDIVRYGLLQGWLNES